MKNLKEKFKIAETLRGENGKRVIADRCQCTIQAVYQVLNPDYPDASERILNEINSYIKQTFSENNIRIGGKAAA